MLRSRRLAAVAAGVCLILLAQTPSAAGISAADEPAVYTVTAGTAKARTQVVDSGVQVLEADHGELTVAASPAQAEALRAAGLRLDRPGDREHRLAEHGDSDVVTRDFPPADSGYHNFAELTAEVRKAATDFPAIAKLTSLGKSHENRDLWLVKISDNVAADEAEPEVLFTCNQHAREHLAMEMCLRIINRFTAGYATDPAIKKFVDSREISVITSVNPDGAEYDVATGRYRSWRLNRQPNGTSAVGTDLNRNWSYKWGCCGGSSSTPGSETYRGTKAFSAPETKVVSDYVNSRVVGGKQQITTHIDWHTYGELVMWPFGYTKDDTAPGLNTDELNAMRTLGQQMAKTNGYTPQQASDLYITDGGIRDWMWGQHKIWSYTFEMFGGSHGFYPPDELIGRETTRNDKAVDLLLSYADCVPRVVGKTCA